MGLENFKADWFQNNSIQQEAVARDFFSENDVITFRDTEEIYYYEDGVYHPHGDQILKEWLVDNLGSRYSKHIRLEMEDFIQAKSYVARSEFGMPHDWVCLQNSQYNFKTGEQRSHSPDDGYLSKIDYELVEGANCPKFDKFLMEHLGLEQIIRVWKMFGHAIHRGYPAQKAFIMLGESATGKTTVLNVLEELLGRDSKCSIEMKRLKDNEFAPSNLYGNQANIVDEAPNPEQMKHQIFKRLTGDGTIEADVKNKQEDMKFKNTATLIFTTNDMEKVRELSDLPSEYQRRWEGIHFTNPVSEEDMIDKYYQTFTEDRAEMQGILSKAMYATREIIEKNYSSAELDALWDYYEKLEDQESIIEERSGWFDAPQHA